MRTRRTHQLLAAVLSMVMILSLAVVPAGAAVPMGGEAVAETPAADADGASLSSVQRPAVNTAAGSAELLDAAGLTEVDVWDFGAEQLPDTDAYHFVNHLTADVINAWYTDVAPGTSSTTFPSTGMPDVDGLSYTTAGAANHRLRTTNTALTRYDDKTMTGDGSDPYVSGTVTYTGYIYSNSSKNTNVYFQLEAQAGDIVTAIISSNGTDSLINWEGPSGVEATCLQNLGSSSKGMTMTFYAKETGSYKIYSSTEKLTMARLYRQHAKDVTVSGAITEAEGMPASYSVLFTNTKTGAQTAIAVSKGTYSGTLKAPYSYEVSLQDANGFALLEGADLTLAASDTAVTHDLTTQGIDQVTVSGSITGLDDELDKVELLFTPTGDGIVYVPAVTVDAAAKTYSVQVEKGMPSTISAKWINDYEITAPADVEDLVWTENATVDLTFAKKPTYAVTIDPEGLTLADLADATFTFSKLDEAGETEDQTIVPFDPKSDTNLEGEEYHYVYTFTGADGIALRDGTYDVAVETAAGKQNVTSNLVVDGAAVTKTISFTPAAAYVAPGTYDFSTVTANAVPAFDGMKFVTMVGHGDSHGINTTGGSGSITLSLAELSNITLVGCQYSGKVDGVIPTPATSAGEIVTTGAVDGTADPVYTISGVSGEVTISFSATAYVHSITVESATPKTVAADAYDFTTGYAAGDVPAIDGMKFTNLKWHNNHGLIGQNGSTIVLNMKEQGAITVTSCCYGTGATVTAAAADGTELTVTAADGTEVNGTTYAQVYTIAAPAGAVTVTFGSTVYIHSIEVEYPNFELVPTEWNFRSGSSIMGTDAGVKLEQTTGVWESLAIDASSGKFDSTRSDWAQFNSGTKITVPIYGGVAAGEQLTVTVNAYTANTITVAGAANTLGQADETYTITVDEGHTFDIVATANTYLGSIKVNYADGVIPEPSVVEDIVLTVGTDKTYKTITAALEAAAAVTREATQRITIEIDPGDYEEQLYIKVKNLTLKNASETPSIALTNKGVGIDANAVRITWYYGHGYTYYSMTNGHRYDADVLAVNKANGYPSYINSGSGTTDDSYWNASVLVAADGFQAEGIIFENSFNQYVSAKSVEDVIVPQGSAKEGGVSRADMKTVGDTTVQQKDYVERAGAVSIKSGSNIWFDNCAFVGRQDVLYGPEGSTVALYGCDIYGGTDYIYGGMTMVAAKCNLILNTSENNNDVAYITAPQQKTARGYLMYNCTIKSTEPGVNTASTLVSKPCYFGRPWNGATGEAVFLNTNIEHTAPSYIGAVIDKNAGDAGKATASLILPVGWNSSLGGESGLCAEYGTVECCEGVDNTASRASWAAQITDTSNYTVAAFLGDWDPFTDNGKDMAVVAQTKHTAIEAATLPETITIAAPSSTTLAVGQEVTLTATVTPAGAAQEVTWSSGDVTVATVDADGKVTAVAGGEVTITARTANGMLSAAVKLVVNIPVTGVTLNKSAITMNAGRSTTLTATVEPANATNQTVTWDSSDVTVVTVDNDGRVKAIGGGTATVTVTTADGKKTAECAVTINGDPYVPDTPVAVTAITVTDPDGATAGELTVGTEQTLQLTATVEPADAAEQGVTWTSSSETVTVSDTGLVAVPAGAEAGTVTITATTKEDGSAVKGDYVITLVAPAAPVAVEAVTVTAESKEVAVGGALTLTATVTPAGADQTVTWDSNDVTVAVVSNDGVVTGIGVGAVTITAASVGTDADGKTVTGTITLTVVEPADALADAIKAAKTALEDTEVSEDGSDVYTNEVWTTQAVRDALSAAIETAEAVAAKEDAADAEKTAAADDLNAALAKFVAEQKEGAKRRASSPAIGTTTAPANTTTTKTVTNDNGDVAKIVTASDGSKEITVTNADGEVVAEVSLPAAIPAPATGFVDVPAGHWAEAAINDMAGLGLVKGVNEAQDLFDMTSTMTRASVATIFYRLSGSKAGFTSAFEDVAAGQWYADAVGWAAKTGVVTGYSDAAFGPDDTITRQQLAVMLQRYANLIGTDATADADALAAFADAGEADSWAVDGLAWCVENGVMKGRGGDVLDPAAPISRAEAAAMFDRMIALMRK